MALIWQYIKEISSFGNLLRGIVDISIIYVAGVTIRSFCYKTVNLSIGSFKIRHKDFTVQNVTNLVSLHFFDGGKIPDNVRLEILQKTSPKIKNLIRKTEENVNE